MAKINLIKKPASQSGFALLMTLIVVTVIVSIGLSVLDLSIKQVRLATNAKDSEIAFHAANAGMECARYTVRTSSSTMERGGNITPAPSCFSTAVSPATVSATPVTATGDGEAYVYRYSFSWSGNTRCSVITALVASSTAGGTGLFIAESVMETYIPGYPDENGKDCAAGERCTVLSVRGHNKPCVGGAAPTSYGVVQREVLLQF